MISKQKMYGIFSYDKMHVFANLCGVCTLDRQVIQLVLLLYNRITRGKII